MVKFDNGEGFTDKYTDFNCFFTQKCQCLRKLHVLVKGSQISFILNINSVVMMEEESGQVKWVLHVFKNKYFNFIFIIRLPIA